MPTYKLTYFDVRSRGETARMLFKLADQPFEDIRISFEDWPKVKESRFTAFLMAIAHISSVKI